MKLVETVITNVEFEVGDVVMFLDEVGFYKLGDVIVLRKDHEPERFKAEGAGFIAGEANVTQKWLHDLLEEGRVKLLGELK